MRTDDSFVAFVSARSGRLVAYAELLCGDHEKARDLVQGVLTKAYPRWDRIEQDDPYGYLCRAITNAVTDWWRRAYRRREQLVGTLPEDSSIVDDTARFDDRRTLIAALQQLTPAERAVVVLRYLHDYTERDVAEILGVRLGTVKSTCHKALRKLRVAIEPEPGLAPSDTSRGGE
ncbi:SigE family RNA polymerase sigma factor [Actinoplanes sp. NPDC051861]|uniref:SigE family RNA polymerase sigma factor n=1 Tax=Actinoplanes sp. NPDC051861 TaxID=3155170 RepID=UPI0034130C7A